MAGIIRAASSATSANPHTRGIIRLQFPADATELCRRRSGGAFPNGLYRGRTSHGRGDGSGVL